MKKVFSLILMFLLSVNLFVVSAAPDTSTSTSYAYETFYAYKDAYYYESQVSTTYNASWDGYYRVMYKHNYKTQSAGNIQSSSLTISDTGARAGEVARYCFGNQDYYVTKVGSDIDYYDNRGWPIESYWQPQVELYIGGSYKGVVQYRNDSVNVNGWLDGNWYARNSCVVWKSIDNNTGRGRNTTGAGGANYIKYYIVSSSTYSSGWQWDNANTYKNNHGNIHSITGTTTGYLKPNWQATTGWRSSVAHGEVKRGAYSKTTAYDRKSVNFRVSYNVNGGQLGTMWENINNNKYATTLATNGFTREGYKFIGWNTKPDGTGTSYSDKESILKIATDNGSITLYAQWEALDLEPPVINDETLIKGACYNENNFTKWTNQNLKITLSATDNMKMKSLTLKNSSDITLKTVTAKNDEKTLSFDYTFTRNGKYRLIAIDWNKNETTYDFEIVCIDKKAPTPSLNLACGSTISYDTTLKLSFTDDLSGMNYSWYQYEYTEADGTRNLSPINQCQHEEGHETSCDIDITSKIWYSSAVSLRIGAYDWAGNVYTTDTCTFNVAQQFITDTTLNDYSQIVALYNKHNTSSGLSVLNFLADVNALKTDTSKAFLKYIDKYKKADTSLTDEQAINKFIEEFGLSNQIIK